MKKLIVPFVLSLFWSFSRSCITPLGDRSNCIPIDNCPSLLKAFDEKSLRTETVNFLRQSHCGFSGSTPKVCCGPLPSNNVVISPRASDIIDPVLEEDSKPSRDSCGTNNLGDKILSGNMTELDEFPWMAMLGYKRIHSGDMTYECGGVLLNKRYVLTAAHCITGRIEIKVGKLASARLGEYDTRTDIDCVRNVCADRFQEIPVVLSVPHPGYRDSSRNKYDDIGLLRLARRVTYNFYVQPICLVNRNEHQNGGAEVVVAGWGKTLEASHSFIKMKLSMAMVNYNECYNKFQTIQSTISIKQLCAGGEFAKDSCAGDSGGPLMKLRPEGIWECVGIVSLGYGCGRDGWPGIYTSVASYIDWIQSTMQSTNQ